MVQHRLIAIRPLLAKTLRLGHEILVLMIEPETVWQSFKRLSTDEGVKGKDLIFMYERFNSPHLLASHIGESHWEWTKDGLANFLSKVSYLMLMSFKLSEMHYLRETFI